jgi:hypothetical protein
VALLPPHEVFLRGEFEFIQFAPISNIWEFGVDKRTTFHLDVAGKDNVRPAAS